MNDRLVTVATFDTTAEAHIALNALQDAAVWANLAGEHTVGNLWSLANADSGIKLLVREVDAARALEVIGPLASVRTGEQIVSDEELERQALEATPEPGEEPPPEPTSAPTPTLPTDPTADQPIDRDKLAWRAFWFAWFGIMCVPLTFVALYLFLRAAFGPGDLSRLGRIRLWAAGGVLLLAVIPAGLSIGILSQVFNR
jgi:hypothetical protein